MNYLKIGGQLVCKMLVLLAFVFAACSDELSGGVTEETRVYALSGRVGDVYPIVGVVEKNETSEDSLALKNKVFAKKGSIVSVYELDASTFAETGRVFVDTVGDEGLFSFDSLPLESLDKTKDALEASFVQRALKQAQGNQREAAKLMQITYDQFRGLYRKHGKPQTLA